MKKIAILGILILVFVLASGCVSSPDPIVGTWELTDLNYTNETEISDIISVFNEDGTGTQTYYYNDTLYSNTYDILWAVNGTGTYVISTVYPIVLSDDEKVLGVLGSDYKFSGDGFIGTWTRDKLEEYNGTSYVGTFTFNDNNTGDFSWYYENGTLESAYPLTWSEKDGVYSYSYEDELLSATIMDGNLTAAWVNGDTETYARVMTENIAGTWGSDANSTLVFNEDGTGTGTSFHGNNTDSSVMVWTYNGDDWYNIDYPDTVTLSSNDTIMSFDSGGVFTGDGFVGIWTFVGNYSYNDGAPGQLYIIISDDNTGVLYWKCDESPVLSAVQGFSWKKTGNGYYFYNYCEGALMELSNDGKTQTILNEGIQYTGDGLIGTWNRTDLLDNEDGTFLTGQRIFNTDGSAFLTWYADDGTVTFVHHQNWSQLFDGYYAIVNPYIPLVTSVLNDDGSLTYYNSGSDGLIYHKL